MDQPAEIHVTIRKTDDVVAARKEGRELAARAKFSSSDVVRIATAISELARNIVLYAGEGEIQVRLLDNGERGGIEVIAWDHGPGMEVEKAMVVGYSSSGSLGVGLPGVRRLMDEFEITSEIGQGTTIKATKWRSQVGW